MPTELRIVYITSSSLEEAQKIAKILVKDKLAACVNIYPGIQSVYEWDGKFCEAAEVVLLAKTKENLVETLMARAKELHSYDCPTMLSLTVDQAYKPYADWLLAQV